MQIPAASRTLAAHKADGPSLTSSEHCTARMKNEVGLGRKRLSVKQNSPTWPAVRNRSLSTLLAKETTLENLRQSLRLVFAQSEKSWNGGLGTDNGPYCCVASSLQAVSPSTFPVTLTTRWGTEAEVAKQIDNSSTGGKEKNTT